MDKRFVAKWGFRVCVSMTALSFLSAVYLLGYLIGVDTGEKHNPKFYDFNGSIIKTVAHINLDGRDDMELIYKDVDKDVALYMYTGERPWPECGAEVQFYRGEAGTIIATDVYGFTVKCDDPITFGYSGTSVTFENGRQIGYVSEMLENGNVYCIWI